MNVCAVLNNTIERNITISLSTVEDGQAQG